MVLQVVCIFVSGHLSLLKDVNWAIQQILPSNANKVLCLFEVHLITRITRGTASGLEGQTYGKQLNLASKVKNSKNVVNKT